jgi:hypothetical protein
MENITRSGWRAFLTGLRRVSVLFCFAAPPGVLAEEFGSIDQFLAYHSADPAVLNDFLKDLKKAVISHDVASASGQFAYPLQVQRQVERGDFQFSTIRSSQEFVRDYNKIVPPRLKRCITKHASDHLAYSPESGNVLICGAFQLNVERLKDNVPLIHAVVLAWEE